MRILLITLTLTFALVSLGAAPAFADKVVIVNSGCDHDDRYRHSEHNRWKKHNKNHEYREVRHKRENRRHGPAHGHFVAMGGPTFGFWMSGR